MLIQVVMERGTTITASCEFNALIAELLHGVAVLIFNNIEVRVIAIARHFIAIFAVPFCIFYTQRFGWYKFSVELAMFSASFDV